MGENKARIPMIWPNHCCDIDEGKVVGNGTWRKDSEVELITARLGIRVFMQLTHVGLRKVKARLRRVQELTWK